MQIPRGSVALVSLALLTACDEAPPPPAAKETAPPSATPAPSAAALTVGSAMAPKPSAAPAVPGAVPTAKAPASPEPEIKEWDAVTANLGLVKNGSEPGCMARRVREWIRVGCAAATTERGKPIAIQIVKGFPRAKYSILEERGGSTMLVFPATEGLDGEATFTFAGGTFRFTASWPSGQPEPKVIGSFEDVTPPSVGDPDYVPEVAAPADGTAAPNDKPVVSSASLPELPVVEGAPTAEQWASAKDVSVKGSDAHGCETRQLGDWFRVVCRSNSRTGKVTAAKALQTIEPKDGYLVTGNGALVLLVKYVRGVDVSVDVTWDRASGRLTLTWPANLAGPPATRGEVTSKP